MGWILGMFLCAFVVVVLIFAANGGWKRGPQPPIESETEGKIRAGLKREGVDSRTVWGK